MARMSNGDWAFVMLMFCVAPLLCAVGLYMLLPVYFPVVWKTAAGISALVMGVRAYVINWDR